ncbi:cupin domain-containing protein [Williamsia deligens]|uniref:Cupin domain-containing protein n=1 Tax=Williamsia deligens TaxID=321325 RepID=A0ABW3GB69_9NOCA|nr:cupin domain-containing protein [Williamsia deligens]MCP2193200.1 Cupin superfamily protein [Williamsia deligens]
MQRSDTLTRCVAVDPSTFAANHWGVRPLLSPAADLPRDFSDLLSPAAVDELLAERGVRAPFIRMAKNGSLLGRDAFLSPAGVGAEIGDQVDSAKALAAFADGASIVLQGLHRLWPPVIDFVRGLVDDLGHPVQANAYITPPGSQGFDSHHDVHDVFVLQISGHKHWTVHEPVVESPLSSQPWTDHRSAITERVAHPPHIDTTLAPGDALYLPRGWLHSARTTDETSIHLTIGIPALTRVDVVRAAVDRVAAAVTDLRTSLPMGVDPTDHAALEAEATKALLAFADQLRDRAHEWGSAVADDLTREMASRTRPVAVRPLATLDAISSVSSVQVAWRHGLIASVTDDAERVHLRLADRTISFPAVCTAAIRHLVDGNVADVSSLPGLDEADSAVLLRRLLRESVVVAVSR